MRNLMRHSIPLFMLAALAFGCGTDQPEPSASGPVSRAGRDPEEQRIALLELQAELKNKLQDCSVAEVELSTEAIEANTPVQKERLRLKANRLANTKSEIERELRLVERKLESL